MFDCVIMVLKYMQLWDGVKKYDGNNMPPYTCVSTNNVVNITLHCTINYLQEVLLTHYFLMVGRATTI